MKKYVPENDPESEALRDIFQCNKDFETNLSQLGGDYDYQEIISYIYVLEIRLHTSLL